MLRSYLSAVLLASAIPCIWAKAQRPSQPASPETAGASTSSAEPVPSSGVAEAERASSQVRIVRLSQIQGVARLDRNTGSGFETAFANIPVTTGSRLETMDGTAEVEFEDGSTLRLAPASEIYFKQLGRTAAGSTVSVADVLRGTAYVSLAKTPAAVFTLTTEGTSLRIQPGSHIRLDLDSPGARVAVLDGSVALQGPAGDTIITRKQSISFDPVRITPYVVASAIPSEPFDSWDKQAAKYQRSFTNAGYSGGSGLLFGSADLNYYGSFADTGGCGSLWRPYFASAAWDPYGAGTWAWYPSVGYSWISPYPWGWMPYHSGSWQFCPSGGGWGWAPGAAFQGLANMPIKKEPVRGPRAPEPPTGPRAPQYIRTVQRPLETSRMSAPGFFTFRADSAGLGVPRETFGKLKGVSSQVSHHGFATTEAEIGEVGGRSSFEGRGGAAGLRSAGVASHSVAVISRPSGGGGTVTAGGYASAFSGSGAISPGGHSYSAPSNSSSGSHSSGGGVSSGSSGGGAAGGGGHH